MATPFKDHLNPTVITQLGGRLADAWAAFPRDAFEAQAQKGLEQLELKARVHQIAEAMGAHLPSSFPEAARVVLASCEPGLTDTSSLSLGWGYWAVQAWVPKAGLDHPELALDTIAQLTTRWSGEFAVRPFLAAHWEVAFPRLMAWTQDPNPHVRRLASEGSRPRLPWGERLPALVADPTRTRPILDALADDPERYVTRSVANHLGDWAKDHVDYAVEAAGIYGTTSRDGAFILRHGLRHPVKQGHRGALAQLGFAPPQWSGAQLVVEGGPSLHVGEPFALLWTGRAEAPGRWMFDYSLQGPSGRPKVFKGSVREVGEGEVIRYRKKHTIRPVTTRRLQLGPHVIRVILNGEVVGEVAVEVFPASA